MSLKTHASQANKGIQISVRSKHGGSFELQLRPDPCTIEIRGLRVIDPQSRVPPRVDLQMVVLMLSPPKLITTSPAALALAKALLRLKELPRGKPSLS